LKTVLKSSLFANKYRKILPELLTNNPAKIASFGGKIYTSKKLFYE